MQTLGALAALLAASILAMNMQRAAVRSQLDIVSEETSTYAGSVALDVLDYVSTLPFDEATKSGPVASRDSLTFPLPTGRTYEAADDIGEFNQIQPYAYTSDYADYGFTVDVDVQYVSEDDGETPAGAPTYAKLVTVTVTNDLLARYGGAVTLSQVMTYDG